MLMWLVILARVGYLFSLCTEEKALEILRDSSVLPLLSFYPVGMRDVEKYLIDEDALLVVMPKDKEVEVHIAAKYRSRASIREALEIGIKWLKQRGFSRIVTTAPDERKALVNLLKSLGFCKDGERWIIWA